MVLFSVIVFGGVAYATYTQYPSISLLSVLIGALAVLYFGGKVISGR